MLVVKRLNMRYYEVFRMVIDDGVCLHPGHRMFPVSEYDASMALFSSFIIDSQSEHLYVIFILLFLLIDVLYLVPSGHCRDTITVGPPCLLCRNKININPIPSPKP